MFICLKIKYTLSQEHIVFIKSFSFQIENILASALTNFFFFFHEFFCIIHHSCKSALWSFQLLNDTRDLGPRVELDWHVTDEAEMWVWGSNDTLGHCIRSHNAGRINRREWPHYKCHQLRVRSMSIYMTWTN